MEKFRERKLKRLEHQQMRHDPSKYVNTGIHRDSKEAAIDHYHRKHQQKTKTRQERTLAKFHQIQNFSG